MYPSFEDTIVAVATPPGEGGVAIVRLSGAKALEILKRVVTPLNRNFSQWQPRKLTFAEVHDESLEALDQVLAVYMPGPFSFTGEDVAEIQCHGGRIIPYLIVDICVAAGARLAERGEFSFRAFMNGRIDLSQAESLLKVIEANSKTALKLANGALNGALSKRTDKLRAAVIELIAQLEAALDYGDEMELVSPKELGCSLQSFLKSIQTLIASANEGQSLSEGINTVLLGPPNAGKSTLWNGLIGEERALVTPYPGTTRDQLESLVYVDGLTLHLVDTAGLHETNDPVERLGIEKTREAAAKADLALIILDASSDVAEQLKNIAFDSSSSSLGFSAVLPECLKLVILNKADLPEKISYAEASQVFPGVPIISACLKRHSTHQDTPALDPDNCLKDISRSIASLLRSSLPHAQAGALSVNQRERQALQRCQQALNKAWEATQLGMPFDCFLLDLHEAANSLGEISGRNLSEDILDEIFSKFCLGK